MFTFTSPLLQFDLCYLYRIGGKYPSPAVAPLCPTNFIVSPTCSMSRRSKIRPPRKTGVASDYQAHWEPLSAAIGQIQNQNVLSLLYEQLYRKAYTLVLEKQGQRLYSDVARQVAQHLEQRHLEIAQISDREDFLKAVVADWNRHLQLMKFISDVLMYMNRVFVKENRKLLVYDLGVVLWGGHFVRGMRGRLVDIVIGEIERSRRGEVLTTRLHIAQVVAMFELLSLEFVGAEQLVDDYEPISYVDFEKPLLESQQQQYQAYAELFVDPPLGSRYVNCVYDFVTAEEARCKALLPASWGKLEETMYNVLITQKIDYIMQLPREGHSLAYWMEPLLEAAAPHPGAARSHVKEMGLLYKLVGRIDGERKLLKVRLKEAIAAAGSSIPRLVGSSLEKKGPAPFAGVWIETVLAYHRQLSQLNREAFDHDVLVERAMYEAMRDVANQAGMPASAPELLAVYMDAQIKASTKGTESKDFLEKALAFVDFLRDKDAFEAHYAQYFAKRFLNAKAQLGDLEELVLAKLGERLGSALFEKTLRMQKDVKALRELTASWRAQSHGLLVELDLKVCHVVDWPKAMTKDHRSFSNGESVGFIWPRPLRETMRAFEEFWAVRNESKLLFWSPKFGLMDLRIAYPSRTYDVNVATYAGIVLLLFAPAERFDEQRLLYEEIRDLTKIPEGDLKRHLQLIAVAPRLRLLTKTPMSREIHAGDVFALNARFKSPTAKVKVLTVLLRLGGDDVLEAVERGREHAVNAAIVRVMKLRRRATHNELVGEVVRQVKKFAPLALLIKRRIEDLIEREYLRRDETDMGAYHYIA